MILDNMTYRISNITSHQFTYPIFSIFIKSSCFSNNFQLCTQLRKGSILVRLEELCTLYTVDGVG